MGGKVSSQRTSFHIIHFICHTVQHLYTTLSQIYINGKTKHLGRFDCELEASKKYQEELGKLKSNC